MKTVSAKTIPENRSWYVVDATDRILGRLASQVASRLRGKHQPTFTPHADTGDFIIVVNAEKVRLTTMRMLMAVAMVAMVTTMVVIVTTMIAEAKR